MEKDICPVCKLPTVIDRNGKKICRKCKLEIKED
jgi:hypothetical protein